MSSTSAAGAAAPRPPKHSGTSAQQPKTALQMIYDQQMAAISRTRDAHLSGRTAKPAQAASSSTDDRDMHPAKLQIPEDPREEERLPQLKRSALHPLSTDEKRRSNYLFAIATTQADQSLSPFERLQKIHFFRDREWIQNNSDLTDNDKQQLINLISLSSFQLIPYDPSFKRSVTAQISRMYGILEHWKMDEKELDDEDRQIKLWITLSLRCCIPRTDLTEQQQNCLIDFLNNKFNIESDPRPSDEEKKLRIHLLIIEIIKSNIFPFSDKNLIIEFLLQKSSRLHPPWGLTEEETCEFDYLFRKETGLPPSISREIPSSPGNPSSPSLSFPVQNRSY